MNILVTGGAGYIGSHAALKLLELGHSVTIIDDLSRGHYGAIHTLEEIGGDLHFSKGCFGNRDLLDNLLKERHIQAIMHFAALTYVGESVQQPLRYYRNNTANALTLIEQAALTSAANGSGTLPFIFSSTCATYGEPVREHIPITENCPQKPVNPYGASKLMVERMLLDASSPHVEHQAPNVLLSPTLLRYFNVAGCDPQGRIGEHHEPETHLIPICLDAALGIRPHVTIFGVDYPTPDGTCIRDYIHVSDLIDAHIAALDRPSDGVKSTRTSESCCFNIGIGRGYSVREVIEACKTVTGVDFEVKVGERRPGDPPVLYADAKRSESILGFSPKYTTIEAIVETAWRWRKANPQGYAK